MEYGERSTGFRQSLLATETYNIRVIADLDKNLNKKLKQYGRGIVYL